jgi:hypothetical protein
MSPRPTLKSKEVLHATAVELANSLGSAWAEEHAEISELVEVLTYAPDFDGYAIGKSMDNDMHFTVDASIVEILDNTAYIAHEQLKKAEAKWVTDNEIKPTFKVGDIVECVKATPWTKKKAEPGAITEINEKTAKYHVHFPSRERECYGYISTIVNYEDVQLSPTVPAV